MPNLPFLLAIAIAGLTCMVFSVLIGFPALRVQGPWLAFVTLAFNLLVFLVLNNEEASPRDRAGIRILRDDLTVLGIDMSSSRNYYYFCLVFLVAATVLVWWIVRSPWGRALKALRDNPARAASLGVDIRTYTLLAFSIGAGLAGVAGALYARLIEYVDPRGFYIGQSFDFFLATVVGGLGTLVGPFIGVVVHHGARRPAAFHRRLLPSLVRPVRRRHDAGRAQGRRRIVQPAPRMAAEATVASA